jgi:hypothetical protein
MDDFYDEIMLGAGDVQPCDLPRAFQYYLGRSSDTAKRFKFGEKIQKLPTPDFSAPGDVHELLARLNLPIYITTCYDLFLERSKQRRHRAARTGIFPWKPGLFSLIESEACELVPAAGGSRQRDWRIAKPDFQPEVATPLIFHMLGFAERWQSMAVSEDDHLDVLEQVTALRDPNGPMKGSPFGNAIGELLPNSALLLIGFRMDTWELRVVLRSINALKRTAGPMIAVQLMPEYDEGVDEQTVRANEYLAKYLQGMNFTPYVRTPRAFVDDLIHELATRGVDL